MGFSEWIIFRFSTKQKLLVLVVSLAQFSTFASVSLLGPFFPEEALRRGVSTTVQGVIIGLYALGQVFFSPICGKLIPRFGCRYLVSFGLGLVGIFNLLFGLLIYLPLEDTSKPYWYVTLSMLCRIGSSIGASGSLPTTIVVISKHFAEDRMTVLGISEGMIGVGLAAGPIIGGLLYEAGGFFWPFAFMGIVSILACILGLLIVPAEEESSGPKEEAKVEMNGFFFDPRSILMLLSVLWSGSSMNIFAPILEPHLKQMGLVPYQVGFMFCLLMFGYMATAPIVGSALEKMNDSKWVVVSGFVLMVISCLAIGPSPIFGLGSEYRELWLVICSVPVYGVGQAMMLIPTLHQMMDLLRRWRLPDNLVTFGLVSGVWNAMISLGDFIGPVSSGFLYDQIRFQWSLSVYALISFILMIFLIALIFYEKYGTPYWKTLKVVEDEELNVTTPLIINMDLVNNEKKPIRMYNE